MVNTLKQQIAADAADGAVFLNTNEFAETVTYYPRGNALGSSSVTAIVFRDGEEGTREAWGDGLITHREAGDKIRTSAIVVLPASTDVKELRGDLVKLASGDVFAIKRIIARDANFVEVMCVKSTIRHTKKGARSG